MTERVRVTSALKAPSPKIGSDMDFKTVKQILSEAQETRRRSIELTDRLKQFLSASARPPSSRPGSSAWKAADVKLNENDVIEFINDVQDDNLNVMDVRIPRLEGLMNPPTTPMEKITRDSTSSKIQQTSILSDKQARVLRPTLPGDDRPQKEFKILKNLLKETEENNRRSLELAGKMQRSLERQQTLSKPKVKKDRDPSKIKRKTINKVDDKPRTSIQSQQSRKISSKSTEKTPRSSSIDPSSLLKNERPSDSKRSSSVKVRKSSTKIARRSIKEEPKIATIEESSTPIPLTSSYNGSTSIDRSDEIQSIVDSIGRRTNNSIDIKTYLGALNTSK